MVEQSQLLRLVEKQGGRLGVSFGAIHRKGPARRTIPGSVIRSPSQRGDRGPGGVNGFPCSLIQFPARANRIPCSFYPGIRLEMLGFTLHSAALPQAGRPESRISLHNSLLL
jgi:hypothetical protein